MPTLWHAPAGRRRGMANVLQQNSEIDHARLRRTPHLARVATSCVRHNCFKAKSAQTQATSTGREVVDAWPLEDAQNRFSAVVNVALAGTRQQVMHGGKPVVVVLATR